jgi:hypothetical protein
MTTTTLIVYMTLGEVAIVTVAVAIYIIMRARRLKKVTIVHEKHIEKATTPAAENIVEPQLESHIQQLIQQTRKRLNEGHEEDDRVLQARIQFLEAESALLSDDPHQDAYWASVSQHLASLFSPPKDTGTVLAELDDFGASSEPDDGTTQKPKGSIEIDTSQQEISRLRHIIGRQHGAIDELKQSLEDQAITTVQTEELGKKLEHIEVAHAQLNMCIDVLEKENERLNDLLASTRTGDADPDIQGTRQPSHQVNDSIGNLEQENATQAQRIQELETEINSLQAQLDDREELLRQVELICADLSRPDNEESVTDPELLRHQIETINNLLASKNNELQQLQTDTSADTAIEPAAESAVTETPSQPMEPGSDIELFTTDDNDDIPVLEVSATTPQSSVATDEASQDQVSSLLDTNPESEFDDHDMIPVSASGETIDQLDDHDIVVEDDYLDSSVEEEVNAFLKGKA